MDIIEEMSSCKNIIESFKKKSLSERMRAPDEEQKRFYEASKRLEELKPRLDQIRLDNALDLLMCE